MVLRRAALLLVLAGACRAGGAPAPQPGTYLRSSYPARTWTMVPVAESAGYRTGDLAGLTTYLSGLPTTAFMAVVHGRVLFSYGPVDSVSYLASVRKSILSMLYGNYVERGTIRLSKTLAEIGIDDRQHLTDAEKQATIADLLGAKSGIFHPASNPGDNLDSAPPRGSVRPGTYYLYSNWDFNALGTIFEKETGRDIFDALESDLARPLQMQDFDRARHRRTGDSTRSVHLAYHMWLSTRDMARIGLLMLREGRWVDQQLVPRNWVRRSTSLLTPTREMHPEPVRRGGLGYGYLWWVLEEPAGSPLEGAYAGRGAIGQYILVVPKLDLVVVHKKAPGPDGSVSWGQFRGAVDRLVAARCSGGCA